MHAEAVKVGDTVLRAHLKDFFRVKRKMYGQLYLRHNKKPWFYHKRFKREEIVTVNRIRCDHYNLAFSLHRKNLTQSQDCHCGEGRKDINHVIFYCPLYRNKATNLIKYLKDKFPSSSICIFHILTTPQTMSPTPCLFRILCIKHLISFIQIPSLPPRLTQRRLLD